MDSQKLDSRPKGRVTSRLVIRKIKEYQTRRDVQNNRGWCSGDQGGMQVPTFSPPFSGGCLAVVIIDKQHKSSPGSFISCKEDVRAQQGLYQEKIARFNSCLKSQATIFVTTAQGGSCCGKINNHTRGSHLVLRVQWTQVKKWSTKVQASHHG